MTRDATPILEQFMPDTGYELSHLLCLSYSLNPAVASALLVRCLPDLDRDLCEIDPTRLKKDEIRRAVRDILPRATFVINGHDSIHGVDRMREFEHLLMDQVEKGRSRRSHGQQKHGSFHPKLLLGLYRGRWDNDLPIYGKCYIGSRNFTLDLADEFGVVLLLVTKSPHATFSNDLSSFLRIAIAPEARRSRSCKHIQTIALLLKSQHLGPPSTAKVKSINLHWQDRFKPQSCLWPILYSTFVKAESIGVVSPWLSEGPCRRIQALGNYKKVQVRCLDSELKALTIFQHERPQRLSVQYGIEGSLYEVASSDTNRENTPPLHAKYYFVNSDRKQTLFFGSANFTDSGLGPSTILNTEILLQYKLSEQLYELSGYRLEKEDVLADEEDEVEAMQQEWLDSLEVDWKEFRILLSVTPPDYNLPMTDSAELDIELYRVSTPILTQESANDSSTNPFLIAQGIPVGELSQVKTEVPTGIKDTDISSLLRFTLRWGSTSLTTTKIVPVPERIVELRRQDKHLPSQLTMTISDYLLTLAELVDGPLTTAGHHGGNDDPGTIIEHVIGSLTLDRFAYRMAIKRITDPDDFRHSTERIRCILNEIDQLQLDKGLALSQAAQLRDFKRALRCVLDQFLRTSS